VIVRSRSVFADLFRTDAFYVILPGKRSEILSDIPLGYFVPVPTPPPRRNSCRTTTPARDSAVDHSSREH